MNTNSKLGQRPLAAIILAAGQSKRFGSPKQVLVWNGKTLIERAVDSCIDAGCERVVVVTGSDREVVTNALQSYSSSNLVSLSQNPNWKVGMHTSIACGMKALLDASTDFESILVLTVDQPLIDAPFLRKMIKAQQGYDASALEYPSGPGVPACFGASIFPRLLNLTTSGGGAKEILRNPRLKTNAVIAPDMRRDIDTFDDWNDFIKA